MGKVCVLMAGTSQHFCGIDHEIRLCILARTIGDPDALRLIRSLATECGCTGGARGLPLGTPTSQLFANACLDRPDHIAKDRLRVRRYVRYIDGFVIPGPRKAERWKLLAEIRGFLACGPRLSRNPKTGIFPGDPCEDIAGYRRWTRHCLPRKRNVRRAARKFAGLSRVYARGEVALDTVRSVVASFTGCMAHCKGRRSAESALRRLVLVRPPEPEEEDG